MTTLAMAQLRLEPVTPMPAWCGGSYHITGGLLDKEYIEIVKSGQAVPSGTNFGPCEDVVKEVRGLDGNVNEVRIQTYPAVPASQVSFEAGGAVDGRRRGVEAAGHTQVAAVDGALSSRSGRAPNR